MLVHQNGEVQTREDATVYVKDMDSFVTVMLLEETPSVLSLGNLRGSWVYVPLNQCQKPHLTQNGKRINRNKANYVRFVVPGLLASSSTSPSPASSTSSPQDTVISTENPATEKGEIMSEESRGNPSRGSAETENTQNEDDEELRSELLQDLPEWRQNFKENLVEKMFNHINTLPALLMNHQCCCEQEWYRARASIVSTLTSRKTKMVTAA